MSRAPWLRRRAVGTVFDAAVSAFLRPFRATVGERMRALRRRTVVEEVEGLPFLVLPDVFNPARFDSGRLLAVAVRRELGPGGGGRSVLDLGTGAGVGAVFAALRGARVVAVDVNPQAVRCARLNAQLHHVEDKIDVRQGDLFGPVAGETFDLVLFNPPLVHGRPTTFLEAAWQGDRVLERFAAGLRDVLAPGGRALLVLSTEASDDSVAWRLRSAGFLLEEVDRSRWLGELTVVVRAERV